MTQSPGVRPMLTRTETSFKDSGGAVTATSQRPPQKLQCLQPCPPLLNQQQRHGQPLYPLPTLQCRPPCPHLHRQCRLLNPPPCPLLNRPPCPLLNLPCQAPCPRQKVLQCRPPCPHLNRQCRLLNRPPCPLLNLPCQAPCPRQKV